MHGPTGCSGVQALLNNPHSLGVILPLDLPNHVVEMREGDMLVLYTDGVTDLLSPDGDSYGEDRLRAVLQEHGGRSVVATLEGLDQSFSVFQKDMPAFDDMTLVAVRRSPR